CCHGRLPPHGHQTMIKKLHESGGGSRHLGTALQVLRSKGPEAAYAALHHGGDYRLKRLGPSFFTKLLYFLGWDSTAGDHRPLTLDQYVVIGMNRCRGTSWRPLGPWSAAEYGEYLTWTHERASGWGGGTEPDVVERTVWEHGR
ncbi:8-oxoguanine DNA glycosylase OGG fold protein, partial [Micromonospora sp. SD12]|uniref:8-oxoguanine DNA glycosylase OGG fold protein n=1 Tax=Micromonospora sp. SD12 TaxID=3452216 RepID=UPI003F88C521